MSGKFRRCGYCREIVNVTDSLAQCTYPLLTESDSYLCNDCRKKVLLPVRCYFICPTKKEEYEKFCALPSDEKRIEYIKENKISEKGETAMETYYQNLFKGEKIINEKTFFARYERLNEKL